MPTTIPRPEDQYLPDKHPPTGSPWTAFSVILAVLIARIVYLVWLSPWQLVGDEAYYWEWSRHLDWCYYEKGPGQAFLIAPFVALFGAHEWAVRLPVALLSSAAAWVLARLAVAVSGGNQRAGLLTVVLFCITPAFAANAQICTQDGMMILVWSVLAAYGLRLFRHWSRGEARWIDWVAPAAWLGIGFLFKQSILLFVPSVAIFAWMRRKELTWNRRVVLQAGVAVIVAALFAVPMVVWNARHGWPTLAHTLGHLGVGGDQEAPEGHFTPLWFLSLIGAQIGAVGPGALALMALATTAILRNRRREPGTDARLWMVCCALPSLAFFVALSFFKSVLGGWPFPSYVTLVVLVGVWGAEHATTASARAFRGWWRVAMVYGTIGTLLLCFPNALARVPLLGKKVTAAILTKMTGHREHAMRLNALRQSPAAPQAGEPIVIARYYMNAALDAFYLPDHPTVYCAGTIFGKRPTAYDFWAATNLADPALSGRSAILDGSGPRPWDNALRFDRLVRPADDPIWIGIGYRGVIPREQRAAVESAE